MEGDKSSFWSRTSILYKAFYFVFYAGYISFLLYVPVYFKYLGLNAIHVGLLNGIRPLMQTIGAPLWGIVGDRWRIRKLIFVTAFIVMTVKTMLFLLFRPKNEICVITYYNASNKIIKNMSYAIHYDITKRSSEHSNTLEYSHRALIENPLSNTEQAAASMRDKSRDRMSRRALFSVENTVNDKEGRLEVGEKNTVSESFTPLEKSAIERRTINLNFSHDEKTLVKKNHSNIVTYTTVYDDQEITYIFIAIILLIIFGDAFDAAVFTLADTSCLDTLGGENYGYYRLWGSAGWGIVTPIIGFVISHFSTAKCGAEVGAYFCIFYSYLGFMYLALLFGSHFNFNYDHSDLVTTTVKSALLNFHYGIFLFVTFYAGFCYGFLLYFVNWFIDSLGGSALVMGTATACKSLVDVLFFFLSGQIIQSLGHLNTVTVSLTLYICAFVSYSYISGPWYAVPIEVLHSGAYALVWSSSVSYLNKAAPAGSSATVQGILQGVYWGLGTGGGTIIGGYVIHTVGFKTTFQAFAVITGIVLAVFLMTQLLSKYSNMQPAETGRSKVYSSAEVGSQSDGITEEEISESDTDGSHCDEEKNQDKLREDGKQKAKYTDKPEETITDVADLASGN